MIMHEPWNTSLLLTEPHRIERAEIIGDVSQPSRAYVRHARG
jgi:hypothetical protein